MKAILILTAVLLIGLAMWNIAPSLATTTPEAMSKSGETCLDKCEKAIDRCEKEGKSKMVCQTEYDKCVLACDKL